MQLLLVGEELSAVEDFRFHTRMPSLAAAARELIRRGMASVETVIMSPDNRNRRRWSLFPYWQFIPAICGAISKIVIVVRQLEHDHSRLRIVHFAGQQAHLRSAFAPVRRIVTVRHPSLALRVSTYHSWAVACHRFGSARHDGSGPPCIHFLTQACFGPYASKFKQLVSKLWRLRVKRLLGALSRVLPILLCFTRHGLTL